MKQKIEKLISENKEVVKFVVLLFLFAIIFHIIYQSFVVGKEHFLRETTALIVGFCLNLIGIDNTVKGINIFFTNAKTFEVIYGCIGIYPVMVFVACVLAYPTTIRNKLIGIVPGIPLLYGIEIVRLTFLGIINVHWSGLFDVTHIYFWQATLILFVILLLFLWITRVVERED